MKTLITIMSVLFLSPVAAQSFGLYEKSGGYETSGGYERSGGYKRSGGYETSDGYNVSEEGYQPYQQEYEHYQAETPGEKADKHSKRRTEKGFDDQQSKAKTKEGKWLTNRHNNIKILRKLRTQIRRTGGVQDPADYLQ
jgi:hypothetical protein